MAKVTIVFEDDGNEKVDMSTAFEPEINKSDVDAGILTEAQRYGLVISWEAKFNKFGTLIEIIKNFNKMDKGKK